MASLKGKALFSIASAGLLFGAIAAHAQAEAQPDPQAEAQPEGQGEAQAQSPADKLAARGQLIAQGDAAFATLRSYENRLYVRGFDIGLASAEGQTEDGPGKQAMRMSLPESERLAFDNAVKFTLARNKYAGLAAKGAEIAMSVPSDPRLLRLRTGSRSPWYALGFDIATAIFGNPSLGAQGNTQTGPGSLGIRNSLSPTGARGFDAAVQYHLSLIYPRSSQLLLPSPAGKTPQASRQQANDLGAGYAVYGAIADKWNELGGATGALGPALSGEADAERGGRFNAFRSGFIYWHPNFGAHAVYGLIGEKWNALGRERNLGYPLTDELPGGDGGHYNDFENNATITWHPLAGTHVVYGHIRTAWIEKGRESANSRCGYPTSDEYDYQNGRRTDFQRGYIAWRRGARAAVANCSVIID